MQIGSQEFLTTGSALVSEALDHFGRIRIRARGTSMAPTIESGDVLELQRCTNDQLDVGDIVFVNGASGFRAHRLMARRRQNGRQFVVTRGDAHFFADRPEPAANVVARIVGVTRKNQSSTVSLDCSFFNRLRGLGRSESARIGVVIRRVLHRAVQFIVDNPR